MSGIEHRDFDVVVVGSGSAGMTAAVVSARLGLDVLLVEKTEYFGGISALSGGGCWIPNNALMKQLGLVDSREAAERYIGSVVGNYLRPDIMKAFLDNGPAMIDFILANTEVTFAARTPAPDYYTELEGSLVGGRSLGSVVYDGRKLGRWFDTLRPPLKEFNAPLGMMLGPLDLMQLMSATKSWPAFWYSAKLFGRYGMDRLSHSRGTRLTMGNALMGRFLRSALDAGVTLWLKSPAKRLLRDGKRVTGIVVNHDGRDVEIAARKGVVLATGGFSANPEMRRKYFPFPEAHQTIVPDGNTGDGLAMALDAGAVMDQPNRRNAIWAVVSLLKKRDGSVSKCPHFFMDLPKPGCIAVNRAGRRFGDEANLELVCAMQDTGSVPAYVIMDDRAIRKYGLGLVWPGGLRLGQMLRANYIKAGRTPVELAQKLGIDAYGLEESIAKNNVYAVTGKDPDFRRGDSDLDRSIGDPTHKPNPCLGPIDKPPYYGVEVFPGDNSSVTGLRVNARAQALDASDQPIPSLYICGLDMNSLWAGHGIANGAYHALNMTFGYIIARELAGQRAVPEAEAA
ncbi:MAG TPA: FAD-dependent oxidoreductase [Rhizomicrobium sp.]|nr:FAD-dependent oxidoreductase [Rhizomicrobium sp.]